MILALTAQLLSSGSMAPGVYYAYCLIKNYIKPGRTYSDRSKTLHKTPQKIAILKTNYLSSFLSFYKPCYYLAIESILNNATWWTKKISTKPLRSDLIHKIRVIKGKQGCQNGKKEMWSKEYNRFIYDLCDQHSKIFNQHIFKREEKINRKSENQ